MRLIDLQSVPIWALYLFNAVGASLLILAVNRIQYELQPARSVSSFPRVLLIVVGVAGIIVASASGRRLGLWLAAITFAASSAPLFWFSLRLRGPRTITERSGRVPSGTDGRRPTRRNTGVSLSSRTSSGRRSPRRRTPHAMRPRTSTAPNRSAIAQLGRRAGIAIVVVEVLLIAFTAAFVRS
jgi:hypothetical protein